MGIWHDHFFEFEDNEPSVCRQVVCFVLRKWGRFGTSIRGLVRSGWLMGLVLNLLSLFFDLSVREGGILFGRAILVLGATPRCATGGQNVDDSNVNVLRSVRVSTMHGHAVRLQQQHGLFIQGN